MPDSFDAKQRPFLPRGYVSLRTALQSYARYWVEKNIISELNRDAAEPVSASEGDDTQPWPDAVGRFIEGHFLNIDQVSEVWGGFRQVLYADEISARSINASGELRQVPQSYWGSADAVTVCESGEVEGTARLEYGGRVIIQEQELEDLLAGRPRSARGGPPPQGLVILAPSDPKTVSAYLPLGYIGIKEVVKEFVDRAKSKPRPLSSPGITTKIGPSEFWKTAHEEARRVLASGELPSFHRQSFEGIIRPLRATDWLPDSAFLSALCGQGYSNPSWQWQSGVKISTAEGKVFGYVIVRLEDLVRVFRDIDIPPHPKLKIVINDVDKHSGDKNSGGRPPKYDDKLFLMEAMSIIYYDGPPATQAELCEKALNAYEAAGHSGGRPSDDWAKREIRPLWRKLNLNGDG